MESSPEFRAFQKSYVVLLNLRHGINSVSAQAFADGLITKDLRDKCSNEGLSEVDRTKCLLDALQDRLVYVPDTLDEFVRILNETSSFDYIARKLITSLNREIETQVDDRRHTVTDFLGNAKPLRSMEDTKRELAGWREEAFRTQRYTAFPVTGSLPTHYTRQGGHNGLKSYSMQQSAKM